MKTPRNLGRIDPQRMHGIPRHLRRAHEATFYFHDRIVEAMKEIDTFGPRTFSFSVDAPAPTSELMAMDAMTLARVGGQGEKAKQLLLGECVLALTADALHYICESLFTYEKGKLSVSLSLMRKPIKENLLMLEWIIADELDFFDAFSSPDRKRLNIDTISPERRKELIAGAIKKIDGPAFADAEVLYDIRYNKGANGLEPLWQKAQHLTTTKHANVLTEVENFNFIFATPQNIGGIYESISPLYLSLAIHFYDVAGRALQRTYPRHRGAHDFDQLCKAAALTLATKNYRGLRRAFGAAMQVCRESLRCTCGGTPEITPTTFARALFSGDFYCSRCGESGDIDLFEAMGLAKQAS